MQVQAVQPRRRARLLEGGGVLVGVLGLHHGEAGDGEVREVLAVGRAAVLVVGCRHDDADDHSLQTVGCSRWDGENCIL